MGQSANPKTRLPKGVPIPKDLKVRIRTLKSELRSFHSSSTQDLRRLQSNLNIAKQMLESPNLEGPEIVQQRSSQALTCQQSRLPISLPELTAPRLQNAWEILTDREEVVDGLIEDINRKTIELMKAIPDSPLFIIKDVRNALVGASLTAPCFYVTQTIEPTTPLWAKALAIAGGLIAGAAVVLVRSGASRYAEVNSAKEHITQELTELKAHLEKVLTNYSQGVEELMERLRFLLPEEEAKKALVQQRFSKALRAREHAA